MGNKGDPYRKSMLTVVRNPLAAQLMGIDAAKVTVFAYALSSALAGLPGMNRLGFVGNCNQTTAA